MAGSFVFGNLISDPTLALDTPLTLADASKGAGAFAGLDTPTRAHLVAGGTLGPGQTALFAPVALGQGQSVQVDADFTPGNLRLYVLDSDGNVVAQNDDSGITDIGSPGTFDPALNFLPPFSGVFFFVITSFDNTYLGNWQFDNAGTVTGNFQLDISADRLPLRDVLDGGDNDFFAAGGTTYRVLALGGNDRVFLGSPDDVANGGSGNDLLDGGGGHDVLSGGKGADEVRGGAGNDALFGGAGNDTVTGGDGDDEIHGGTGADFLSGDKGNDRMFSGFGDLARGGDGDDTISGGGDIDGQNDNDTLTGDDLRNRIDGGDGDDEILGLGGNDTIFGGNGNDVMDGGDGKDDLYFDVNGLAVTVDLAAGTATGQGVDQVTGFERLFATNFDDMIGGDYAANIIFGLKGSDVIDGLGAGDKLYGDDGNDFIDGGSGDDQLFGNNDNDVLLGRTGADKLFGGAGNDILRGGTGRDELTGGGGMDRFVFRSKAEAGLPGPNSDLITDFNQGQSDKINLNGIDANENDGVISSVFFFLFNGAFSGTAGQLRFEFVGDDTRIEGDTNGDSSADFEITLTGIIFLEITDFIY